MEIGDTQGMANTQTKTGPGLPLSLTILAIGLVLGVVGWVVAVQKALPSADAPRRSVPGSYEENLDPGEYHIYAESFSLSFTDLGDSVEEVDLDFSDITIANAGTGELVDVRPNDTLEAVSQGFTIFAPVATFDIADDDRYTISFDGEPGGVAIVSESFSTAWREAIPWGIASIVGTLFTVAGFTMLVMGVVRRNRAKKNQPTSTQGSPARPSPGATPPPPPPGASPNR